MQRRTTDTRKPSQNHASATHLNPFQTRPFGTDIAKKPETPTTDIDFDAQYEHAKSHAHNLANVPVMPPSIPNIQTKSSIENSIETQTTTNPTHQHIQRQTPGISVAKSLNVPTFQELQKRPELEQQNIQSRPLVTPHWAAKPSNSVSPVQAKLTIGQPGDKYEQEADQVASQVVQQINTPASVQATQGHSVQRQEEPVEELQAKPEISSLQRMEEPEEELQAKPEISSLQRMEEPEEELQAKPEISSLQRMEEPEEELQAKPEISSLQRMEEPEEELQAKSTVQRREAIGGGEASQDLDTAINSSRGSGQPLDAGLQQSMGQAMGADFSGVKVHTDAQSDQLNQSIQAKAFTTGNDIFFKQGEYNPSSREGQELLAHELTHVVQQGGNQIQAMAVQRTPEKVSENQGAENIIQRLKWSEVFTGNREELAIPGKEMPSGVKAVEGEGETQERRVFAGQTKKGRSGFMWHRDSSLEIQYDIKDMRQYQIIDPETVFYTAVREKALDPIKEHGIDPKYNNASKPDGATQYNVRGFNYFGKDKKIPNLYGGYLEPEKWTIISFCLPEGTLIERDPEIPGGLRTTYHIMPSDLK